MSCCGKLRQPYNGAGATHGAGGRAGAPPTDRAFVVQFEYTGATGLTVFGPVSGRRYRFDGPGAVVTVDPRDRPGLAAVPRLRQVG
jgi:hypothetical protein